MATRTLPDRRDAVGDTLLVTLSGVAELAHVSRPVASMWRRRFASGEDAFPAAVGQVRGADAFDVTEVAEWLTRTAHGNNLDAQADAAAAAAPIDLSFADPQAVAELEGLIALHAQLGALEAITPAGLRAAAAEVDPDDEVLRREVVAHADRGAPWLEYVARLIDAAYSASAALALVGRRQAATLGAAGSAGGLTADAIALVVETVCALAGDGTAVVLDARDVELSAAIAGALGDEATLTLPADVDAREVRRRVLTDSQWLTRATEAGATPSVVVARVPAARADDVSTMLRAVDDVSLALRDDDAAVVIGPVRALVDPLPPAAEQLRADVLRTGRVRGIARLMPGLVGSAPREALALWVLGAPLGQVAIADRFTVVANLTDRSLSPATRTDLVSDVVASMGGAREVRAHAFRFARFARTATLLARGGSLVESVAPSGGAQPKAAELPALLDAAGAAVSADIAAIPLAPADAPTPVPATVEQLMRDGHLRVIAGTRLDSAMLQGEGLVVVTASDLDTPAAIGGSRVDQLAFAANHPSATLTRPGDVIFRTGPTAAAWVDEDGSKVVAYPARVLRVTAGDPGGLVPEVIAADIAAAPSGPGAWRRWMLRRVAPQTVAPLRQALRDITAARSDLEARAARLHHYAALIVAAAASGAVTMTDSTTAADAASTL